RRAAPEPHRARDGRRPGGPWGTGRNSIVWTSTAAASPGPGSGRLQRARGRRGTGRLEDPEDHRDRTDRDEVFVGEPRRRLDTAVSHQGAARGAAVFEERSPPPA